MTSPALFAVIGNPIAHSRSPDIHAIFAQQCGIDLDYQRVLLPIDGFQSGVDGLRDRGFVGANVTVPFKLAAFAYADSQSRAAIWAGAANTLLLNDLVVADNTDGVGLVRDLTVNLNVSLSGKRILLLGAGGAARGVLQPLLLQQPAVLVIKNRSLEKARMWFDEIRRMEDYEAVRGQTDVRVAAWGDDALETYDVIINATASGLDASFEPPAGVAFADGALAYDMMYGKTTAFMSWAIEHQARVADGWGMLVEQAAKSFEIWHGVTPNTRALIEKPLYK